MLQLLRFDRSCGALLVLLASAPLVACGYGNASSHHDHYSSNDGYSSGSQACGTVEEATIDTGETLDVDAGMGAGAFVEYEAGGTYHVTTSCDAAESGECYWDILVTPLDGAPAASLSPFDLESDDSLSLGQENSIRLVAYTGSDFDGFSFQTDPGAAVEVDALLDSTCGNRYLFWVGDGALRSGAPSNPIDFVPSAE